MARIGDTLRPELGKTDARAIAQGGAAMGRGLAGLGAGIGGYLKQQKEQKRSNLASEKMADALVGMYGEGNPIGDHAAKASAFFKDENNSFKDRSALGDTLRQLIPMAIQKQEQAIDAERFNAEMGIKRGQLGVARMNAQTSRGAATARAADTSNRANLAEQNTRGVNWYFNWKADQTDAGDIREDLTNSGMSPTAISAALREHSESGATDITFAPVTFTDPASGRSVTEVVRHVGGKPQLPPGVIPRVEARRPPTPGEELASKKYQDTKIAEQETARAGAASTDQFIDGLTKLRDHKGFSGLFGVSWGNRMIPGTKAADASVLFDQIEAKGFMISIKSMKGMGALSNAEGQKASVAFNGLNRNMSEKAAKEQLNLVIGILEKGKAEAARITAGGKPKHPVILTLDAASLANEFKRLEEGQ